MGKTAGDKANGAASPGGGGQEPVRHFDVSPEELCHIMKERQGNETLNLIAEKYHGVAGLARTLKVDTATGLTGDTADYQCRVEQFGSNVIPPKKPKSFLQLMWEACQDTTLIILICASIVSLALSLFEMFGGGGGSHEEGASTEGDGWEWVEGVAIMAAVCIVVLVTAFNDWSKERQFRGLQDRICEEQRVDVLRKGEIVALNVAELVVGDIVHVKYGDQVPADGLILQCNDLKVDESSMTGESDLMKKNNSDRPWLLAGTHVMEGSGRMLTVAVGKNSQTGIIFSLLGVTDEEEARADADRAANAAKVADEENQLHKENGVPRVQIQTPGGGGGKSSHMTETDVDAADEEVAQHPPPAASASPVIQDKSVLQAKLTKLTIQIGKAGTLAAVLTVLVLFVRFVIQELLDHRPPQLGWLSEFVDHFIIGITVLVVAVPEGLPLAVTISLAYSVKKMMRDNNLVRHLDACETMGSATTICSDKTGTLTKNRMTVTQVFSENTYHRLVSDFRPSAATLALLGQAISVNSGYTSQIVENEPGDKHPKHLGNKTECGLLGLLVELGVSYHQIREQHPEDSFIKVYTFNSARKSMSTVIALPDNRGMRLLTKGASETILKKCTWQLGPNDERLPLPKKEVERILKEVVEPMASEALRTICVAYRDFGPDEQVDFEDEVSIINNLTCIAITGIEDPVRDEVPAAIAKCQSAGITVRMVTGDNILTARSIATKCGIIKPGQDDFLVIEGKEFNRRIRNKQGLIEQKLLDKVWPSLRVLARSSPTDKHTLVKGIIDSEIPGSSEVVAVTGDGTNDGPALKKADVGFAMGIAGTDVAKEASDIILTDDNFTSIVKAVMWGRNVYDSISKFLQFQLTVNFVAIVLAFTSACIIQATPLKAIHLLWVNLIMDTFASLALATEMPTEELLTRKPYGRTKPLISPLMAKNIIGHGIYQLLVLYIILFAGTAIWTFDGMTQEEKNDAPSQHYTMVFNVFVLLQCFNEINARKIHGERNVFKGIHTNPLFCSIVVGTVIVQGLLVEFGGIVFYTVPLTWDQWLSSIAIGLSSLLWGQVLNFIPAERIPACLAYGEGTDQRPGTQHEDTAAGAAGHGSLDGATADGAGLATGGGGGSGPSADNRSKLLWVRGVTRIQQQIMVVKAFEQYRGVPSRSATHHDFQQDPGFLYEPPGTSNAPTPTTPRSSFGFPSPAAADGREPSEA